MASPEIDPLVGCSDNLFFWAKYWEDRDETIGETLVKAGKTMEQVRTLPVRNCRRLKGANPDVVCTSCQIYSPSSDAGFSHR